MDFFAKFTSAGKFGNLLSQFPLHGGVESETEESQLLVLNVSNSVWFHNQLMPKYFPRK
jgi:hypothetical protein